MNIRDIGNRIRNVFTFQESSDNEKDQEVFNTVTSGGRETHGLASTNRDLKNYGEIYKEDGVTFTAINMIAYNVVLSGFQILGEKTDKIKDFHRRNDIESQLLQATISALVYGDAFLEKVYTKKGDLSRLKIIDPKTISLIEDKKSGKVEKYVQTIDGKEHPISPDNIMRVNFFTLPDENRGISLIGSNIDNIDRRIKTDNQLIHAIERHGTPKYKIKVSPLEEDIYPDDDTWDELEEKFRDIDAKNEFMIPDLVDIENIDAKGVQGVEEYFNYFTSMFAAGLGIPLEGAGLGRGSTEATSRVRLQMFERFINSLQNKLGSDWEREVLDELDPSGDQRMKFGNVTVQDDKEKADWVSEVLKVKKDAFTKNEVRRLFGYEELSSEEEKKQNALKLAKIGMEVGNPEAFFSKEELKEEFGFDISELGEDFSEEELKGQEEIDYLDSKQSTT